MITLLLSFILMNEPKTIYVIHDNGLKSKMLVGDLTRNWREKIDNETTQRLDQIQSSLKVRVKFVNIDDDPVGKFNSSIKDYPVICYTKNGQPEKLDDQAYLMSSFPLLTLDSYINRIEVDWKEHEAKRRLAEREFVNSTLFPHLFGKHYKEYSTFLQKYNQFIDFDPISAINVSPDDNIDALYKEFGHLPSFPKRDVKYPPEVRKWYPYEKEFRLHP